MLTTPKITKWPFKGAVQTVGLIKAAALNAQNSFPVRQLAEKVCENLRSKDYLSEAMAIYHFVCTCSRYMRDPKTVEMVKNPEKVAQAILSGQRPQLDCDDITSLLLALLISVGFSTRIVIVAFKNLLYNGERQYSHVFIQILEPKTNSWVTLDPVAGEKTRKMHNQVKFARTFNVT